MRRSWLIAILGLLITISLPGYVIHRRVRSYGWEYYLRLYPMYAFFHTVHTEHAEVGPFTVDFYKDRRLDGPAWLIINPGGLRVDSIRHPILAWHLEEMNGPERPNDVDINGNGLPNLVLNCHTGADRFAYTVFELRDKDCVLIFEIEGSSSSIRDDDQDGIYEFFGRIQIETGEYQFVRMALVPDSKPIALDEHAREY